MPGCRVTIRLDEQERKACQEQASGSCKNLSEWFRWLASKETGLSFSHERGFASMSPAKRRKVSRAGGMVSRKRKGGAE